MKHVSPLQLWTSDWRMVVHIDWIAYLSQMLLERLRQIVKHEESLSLVTGRRWSGVIFAVTTPAIGRTTRLVRIICDLVIGAPRVEPFEVLCILDRDVGVLHYGHENVLHDGDHEE